LSGVFVDTSAVLALLNKDDGNHEPAAEAFANLEVKKVRLFTSSYVIVETYALLVRRFGKTAAKRFRRYFEPLLKIIWVDESLHDEGLNLLFLRTGRSFSLVDAVSFAVMRHQRINKAFAYDRHFEQEGFERLV
jgi:predicted nucleic acid-binding protein